MFNFKKAKTIVAHDGPFHADDVFAVASISLCVPGLKIVRTRKLEMIQSSDFVVDVGGVYDPEKNHFDHHQVGGAGERSNGIPYAAFGLVWKKYGEQISVLSGAVENARTVAEMVDQRLVQSVDAIDNGVSISKETIEGVRPYDVSSFIGAMNLNWNENVDTDINDQIFEKAVNLAKDMIVREVVSAQSEIEGERFAVEAYEKSRDKRLIVLDGDYPWEKVYEKFPEPLFVISPKENGWRIKAVRKNAGTFENRKDLPVAWAGKRGAELSAITGVPGGVFCHNKLFTAGAETKEGAVAMARVAIGL